MSKEPAGPGVGSSRDGTGGGSDLDLPVVKSRVLRTEVLTALRQAILTGRIPIGTRLLEADVARRMGVSRAPVREAIRQLEQEGLVESFIHRGAIVIGLPEDEIDAIYELRALIEAKAISRACDLASDGDLDGLDDLLDEMRAALERKDRDAIAELDLRFHGRIVELSGFTLLRRIWSSLDGLVRVRSYQALERPSRTSDYFLADSTASHERLIEALRLRDPALAAARATEHILEVPARLRADGSPARADGSGPRSEKTSGRATGGRTPRASAGSRARGRAASHTD